MCFYVDKLNQVLCNIFFNLEGDVGSSFGVECEVKKVCIVVVMFNCGFCGVFNFNIFKVVVYLVEIRYVVVCESGNLSMLCIGKKGVEYFKKCYLDLDFIFGYIDLFENLSFDNVFEVFKMFIQCFEDGDFDVVDVIYGKFKNVVI